MSGNITRDFDSSLIRAGEDAEYITNWYNSRRQQTLMELDRLETVYNERMAGTHWSQRIYKMFYEPERLEAGIASQITLPIPKLIRQTNLRSLPEYASLWEKSEAEFENLYMDFGDIPTSLDEYVVDFVGLDIDETIEIAIVSDADGDYDETGSMIVTKAYDTTAYEMC
jgi:hypothetical protein